METSGFYKNNNGQLIFAPNFVINTSYELTREKREAYQFPHDGWFWFESEELARAYFNLQAKSNPPAMPLPLNLSKS